MTRQSPNSFDRRKAATASLFGMTDHRPGTAGRGHNRESAGSSDGRVAI